jgi:RNA polymerase primary sigma factor
MKATEQTPSAAPAAPTYRESSEYDSVQLYLREIGKTPLLTLEEETKLARRILKGDKAARSHMVSANLRLVVKIAMDYRDFGLPLMDLVGEGNMGLVKAVDRFDPDKGGKLSTYASWWIRQSIQRALANQAKTIRIPVHAIATISKIRRMTRELVERLGRDPTDEEIAIELAMPTSKVAHLRSVSHHPASLDAPIGDSEDSASLGEVVRDESAQSPAEAMKDRSMSADLRSIVGALDDREAEIIRLRFGLDGRSEMTLADVGKKFNVTRERIRQLEQLSIKKLRHLMSEKEAQRSRGDIHEEKRQKARLVVMQEFARSKRGTVAA